MSRNRESSQHELTRLDTFLGVPEGTSFNILVKHTDPRLLNEKLLVWGVTLDEYGMVPKHQRGQWKQLMQRAGISKRYWKDPNLLSTDACEEHEFMESMIPSPDDW